MKIVKRILAIFGVVILVVFLALLLTPILFKGKLLEIAKRELNQMLTAEVDFSDLKLSFIRNFPNAYVALEDLTVTGTEDFEGVTLAAFKSLSVTVDILSVIKMDSIQVKSILLDSAEANARILENGKANWDIFKSGGEAEPDEAGLEAAKEETPEKPPEDEKPASVLKIALNKVEIRNTNLSFRDDSSKMEAAANDLNLSLSGDMTLDNVLLNLNLKIADVNFWMDGIRLLKNAQVGFITGVGAHFNDMAFTLIDSRFNLNEIVLKFNGSVEVPAEGILFDLDFATERTDFKDLLSLIPAIYVQDFASVQTSGNLSLSGDVKGLFGDNRMPLVNASLNVNNAMFRYPDLPKSVDNINIAAKVFFDGEIFDNTTVDLDRLHFEMAGNPFNAEAHIKTPDSDMQVAAALAGRIDLDSVADIVPLEGITLNGLLECDIALAGRMSTLEMQRYEDFDARGLLRISGFNLISPDFPKTVKISELELNFTPRIVRLANLDANIGSSDVSMNGSLENFIPFIFKGQTVRGNLNLNSNNIDLNEFMSGEKTEDNAALPDETEEESAPMEIIEVPKNIDFVVNLNVRRILFDKLNINNTKGLVQVRDGKLQMQNLAMNLLEGSLTLSGEYNTQDIKVPTVDLALDISQFDIRSTLSSFAILQRILPNPQNYAGKVSAKLTLDSVLDQHFNPVLNTVNSNGQLQTQNLSIQNSPLFGALANLINNEMVRTPTMRDLNIKFQVRDGRLIVEPIPMNISQVALVLSGGQGLDMSMDYKLNASVPVSSVGQGAVDLLGKIPGGSRISNFTITGLMGGTVTSPDVRLSVADMVGTVVDAVKEEITERVQAVREQVTERVEEAKEKLNEEIERQIAAINAEAERQVQTIRNNLKQTTDRLRTEANNAANRLEQEAASKTIIQQRLAKTAADKLRDEANQNIVRLEREAENQITGILDSAKKRAEELRNS